MSKKYDKLLEKATDSTLVEADWEMIMNAVDCVRSGEVPPKHALASVRKRYHIPNPHVCHHALLVLEALVKNCGDKFHKEVATKETMEEMKHLAAESSEKVKEKILELIQCWAHAFRDKPEYKIVKDTHALMKLEGFSFPAFREADAMFAAEVAPDWVDSDSCYRCKVTFSLLNRKHHCRNCGQIFCDKCSGRYIPLPHIGIEKEVRVCETCFDKVIKSAKMPESGATGESTKSDEKTLKRKDSNEPARPGNGKGAEDAAREDEELQLALAISQSEAEEKERQRQRELVHMYNGPPAGQEFSSITNGLGYKGVMDNSSAPPRDGGHDPSDNELARYLNRDYWEQRRVEQKTGILRQSPTPSAPSSDASPILGTGDDGANNQSGTGVDGNVENGENGEVKNGNGNDLDFAHFAQNLRSSVEMFVNRIRSDQMRGRSVLGDGNVQTMFMTLTNMHSQLLKHLNELDDRRGYFESLQDKLAQIQDAREAIEALRDEHEQHRRAELLELQRQRQIQMFAKLGNMRQKKHEMLEQQRLVALQRMEEERRQMEIRKQMQLQQQAAMMARYNAPGTAGVVPGQQPAAPYYPGGQQQPQTMYYGPGGVPMSMPNPYEMSQMASNLPATAAHQPTSQPQPAQQHPQQQFPGYGTPGYPQQYGHPHQQPQAQFHPPTTGPIPSTYPPSQSQPQPATGQQGHPQQGGYYQAPYAGQQQAPTQMAPAQSQAPPVAPYYPGSPAHAASIPQPQQQPPSVVYPGQTPTGYPPQAPAQAPGMPMPQYVMAPTGVPYDGQHGQVPQGVYHQPQQHMYQQPQQQHQQHIPEAQLINFD